VTHGHRENIVDVYTKPPWAALCDEVKKLRLGLREGPVLGGDFRALLPRRDQCVTVGESLRPQGDSKQGPKIAQNPSVVPTCRMIFEPCAITMGSRESR
jgi:hypothetical protein